MMYVEYFQIYSMQKNRKNIISTLIKVITKDMNNVISSNLNQVKVSETMILI